MRRLPILVLVASALVGVPRGVAAATPTVSAARFQVTNVNRTGYPCPSVDGRSYQVAGRLYADPTTKPHALTVVLHGGGNGRVWDFDAVPGLNTAASLAASGHSVLVLDMLGYGDSDTPDGNRVCLPSIADTIHQVVQQLRTRGYSRIALGGESGGAIVSWIEATAFDDVDAIIPVGFAHGPVATGRAGVFVDLARAMADCATGRDVRKRVGAPRGYSVPFRTYADAATLMFNSAPEVIRAFSAAYEPDPCGALLTIATATAQSALLAGSLRVPALILLGDHDVFEPAAVQIDRAAMVNADVSTAVIAAAGHIPMLSRSAPEFRATVERWLSARGL